MASQIDTTVPPQGAASTAEVRQNFAYAKSEIEDLQNAGNVHAATSKTTPVDADEIGLIDSAAANVLKKLTWANLKATLATWLETLTATWSNKTFVAPALGTPVSGDLSNCTSNTEAAANNSTQLATTAYADRLTAGTLSAGFTAITMSGQIAYNFASQAWNAGISTGASSSSFGLFKGTTAGSVAQSWYIGENVFATDGSFEIKNGPGTQGISIAPSGAISTTGSLSVTGAISATGEITGSSFTTSGFGGSSVPSANKYLLQAEGASTFRSYMAGADASSYGIWSHYAVNSTATTSLVFTVSKDLFAVAGALSATTSILSSGATSGIGYTTGSGGTVTQITSRTTGVTVNKINGEITLVSAAGSASWQSFTITNSAMGATDKVIPGQKSGTDKYLIHVTNQAAGSFEFTFATTGGTTTEQPVLTFAIIKGSAA